MPRALFRLRALAAALLVLSCTDVTPVEPTPVPEPEALLGSLLERTGLLQCRNTTTRTATATIGPEGGSLVVGPHRLVVPPRALRSAVTITATAPAGSVNVVEFEPHGLEFERSAVLSMSYANCNLLGLLVPKRIAYVDDGLAILEYLLSVDDLLNKRVRGRLDHFSGYAVAW